VNTLRRLVGVSLLYIAWSLVGAAIAIAEGLPAGFGGAESRLSVSQDFVYGMGTALSPPLYWLATQLGLTALLVRTDTWGKFGAGGLAVAGAATLVGALGEPITLVVFAPATFEPVKAVVQAGMIVIPAILAVFGWRELRRRRAIR
jgi:hypothetical protein